MSKPDSEYFACLRFIQIILLDLTLLLLQVSLRDCVECSPKMEINLLVFFVNVCEV